VISVDATRPGAPVFVIAEIGLNHGDRSTARWRSSTAAAWAGASANQAPDAVRRPARCTSCPAPAHVEASSLREFFARFELERPRASSGGGPGARARPGGDDDPVREDALPMLQTLRVDAYKIASGDITYDG